MARRASLYYPALDTLRGIFAITVVLFHGVQRAITNVDMAAFAPSMRGVTGAGAFGVPFFFVLSAFLITNLLLQETEQTGTVHVGRFYLRRILRVWPVYYIVLFGAILVVEPMLGGHHEAWLLPFSAFFANNLMGTATAWPSISFAPLWSVSIEEQFYAVWPWVAKFSRPPVILGFGLVFVVAGLAGRWILFQDGIDTHPKMWFLTWTHMDAIGWGVVAAMAHRYLDLAWIRKRLNWVAWACLGAVLVVQQATSTLIDLEHLHPLGVWAYGIVPLCGALVVAAAAQPESEVGPFWKTPVGLWFGQISYSLYAFHGWAVSWWGAKTGHTWPETVGMVALICVSSVGLGAVGHYVIERPILKFKKRLQVVPSGAV